MTTYGLTPEGYVVKPTEVIRAGMEDSTRLKFGASMPMGDRTFFGHVIGLVSAAIGEVWEVTQEIVASDDPDAAQGERLKALCALTGTTPLPASRSTVTLTLCGDPTTTVDALSRAKTESTDKEFRTIEDATIVLLTAHTAPHAYSVGDRVRESARAYECTVAGTSDASPLAGTGDDIVVGTAHFRYMGEGTGAVDVDGEAVLTGPTVAAQYDIVEIVTPVAGWLSVRNLADAVLGRPEETDGTLRARREAELATAGNTPIDALRADLLKVVDVSSATIFMNNTDTTDGDGVPPHAVEPLIRGGDDQNIFDKLLASVAAGIQTHGTEIGSALDSEGVSWVVKFSRPDEIEIWIELTLTYDARLYPDDGDDQVIAAIVAYGNSFETGHNAYHSALASRAFTVPGVLNVGTIAVDTVDPPVNTVAPVAIALRELAVYAAVRVVVNSSAATP